MLARWIPILDWLPRYKREDLPGDLIAGLTAMVGESAFFASDADALAFLAR